MRVKEIWSTKVHKRDEIRIEILLEEGNEQFDLDLQEANLFCKDLEILLRRINREKCIKGKLNKK